MQLRARRASRSGLSGGIALETTTSAPAGTLAASWPAAARCRRAGARYGEPAARSEPVTSAPSARATSARPLIPAPPMPTKCSRRPAQGLRPSRVTGVPWTPGRRARTGSSAWRARPSASSALRPGQREAIEAVLAGRDTLVVMSTGSGKSAIYQIAGLLTPGRDGRRLAADRPPARPGRGPRERAAGGAAQLNSHAAARPSASRRSPSWPRTRSSSCSWRPSSSPTPTVLGELAVADAVAAGGRRGALHLRVGPRLPARLPAPRRGGRGARPPDDPRPHRDGGAARARRDRRAARPARPGGAHPRVRPARTSASRSSASTASRAPSASCARCRSGSRRRRHPGIVYVATRRQAEELADVAVRARRARPPPTTRA